MQILKSLRAGQGVINSLPFNRPFSLQDFLLDAWCHTAKCACVLFHISHGSQTRPRYFSSTAFYWGYYLKAGPHSRTPDLTRYVSCTSTFIFFWKTLYIAFYITLTTWTAYHYLHVITWAFFNIIQAHKNLSNLWHNINVYSFQTNYICIALIRSG